MSPEPPPPPPPPGMSQHSLSVHGGVGVGVPPCGGAISDVESDQRELEAFVEGFKQRRSKLGVTQTDVGSALGSLSQATICRFESLSLTHNKMMELKPLLQAWLEEAEKNSKPDMFGGKRTSIAAPMKRSLEAHYAIHPRPSSEEIAAIAEELDLKNNVVQRWFCNQRQKQKQK